MAKPCKVTIKMPGATAAEEKTFEQYMDMLYNGGLEKLIADELINVDSLKGDNPFAETATPAKKKPKETKSEMADFMKSRLGEAYGDVKTRAYGRRVAQQRGLKVDEYISVDQRAMDNLATEKFDILKDRYEADEKNIFNDVLTAYLKTTEQEKIDNPGLSYQYQVMLTKIATYFYIKGDKKNSTKFYQAKAETATEAGKTSAALSAMSTPEELMNRILEEDESRDSFLNQVTSGQMTIGEAITQLREIAKITKEEADAIVTSAMPKVKKTATVVTVKPEFKKQREASISAIRDILSKKRAPGALSLSDSLIVEITPHIVNLAKSYIQEGAYSAKAIKNRVWNQIKDLAPGERTKIDAVIDENIGDFSEEIKKNREASATKRLSKAFEGVLDDTGTAKKAVKILSDTILQNDPDYIAARERKQKIKAKDRLKAVLSNKDQVEAIVLKAKNIAMANVDANENADAATKMDIKNEIESLVSDLLQIPIGNVEKRAVAKSLSKEEMDAEIARIASEYYTDPSGEVQSLAERLVENLGVDPAYASALQAEVQPLIESKVQEKIELNQAKIDNIMQGIKDSDNVKKSIIKAIGKGEISDTQFEDALLEALEYKGVSARDIVALQGYFYRLQQLQPGEELYQQINRYINDILNEYDESTSALVARWFNEQFYINALSDLFKTAIIASGLGAIVSTIQHGAFTFAMNPARMKRAIQFANKMKKQGATMGWETVLAKWQRPESRFGETTLLERPEEKASGAVVRVTKKEYDKILSDIISAKGGRKSYFIAQAVLKSFSHAMGSGYRKRKFMPAISEVSMVMMSAQDIIMGGMLQDIYTYIEAERYLDVINKESGVKMKKGTAVWNQQLNELLQTGPERIADLKQEVAQEATERLNMGEALPKGWAKRRLREKIHAAMPSEVVNEMASQAKKSLALQKPESRLGALVYNGLTQKLAIKDKDNVVTASTRTVFNAVFGFARLSVIMAEYSYKALPVLPAVTKLAYGKNIRYVGAKNIEVPMTREDKVRRLIQNAIVTAAWAGVISSMFDWEDDEEGDTVMTLDPNSQIKFYGSADDGNQKAEMEAEGAEPNSVTVFGKNISLSLLGFGAGAVGKILGEVSNDIRFGKDDKKNITFNRVVGLVGSQISGSDYSSIKRATKKLFTFGEAKYLEAGEILLLDGVETSLSPALMENLKKDYEAWKGIQQEKRVGVVDNIVSDIFFTDIFMDTNGGLVYDHFGQPVYVKPSNPILKALVPESVWKDGTSHVEKSPYYSLTEKKWFPKAYTRFDAEEWEGLPGKRRVEMSEDFKPSLKIIIDAETADIIDKRKGQLERLSDDKKVEKMEEFRQDAIKAVKDKFSRQMLKAFPDVKLGELNDDDRARLVYQRREEVVKKMREEYGIETK
jgi:hypothetical protein